MTTAATTPHSPAAEAWTDDDIAALARGFEDLTLPLARWTHAAHLAVALWYAARLPEGEALARMRHGIREYNLKVAGKTFGYHETITRAWIAVVARFARARAGQPLGEIASQLMTEYGRSDALLRYWSREVLMSDAARAAWVPPDRAPLDAGKDIEVGDAREMVG